MKKLARYSDQAYALLRIVTGCLFAFHGMQKILGILSDHQPAPGSQLWIGGWIALLGGLAVALGFHTRLAAFLCSGTMAVAYVQFHWQFRFTAGIFPAINKGELAALYSFVFLMIACRGRGIWSVDRKDR